MESGVILLLSLLALVHSQDAVGRVFIGGNENDTTTAISFNENYSGTKPIPVYVGIYNSTTGEQIPIEPNQLVRLTCELIDGIQLGFTYATFSVERIVIIDTIYADIDFLNAVPGRPTPLQCWGESVRDTLFVKETSLSSPVTFEVRPSGTANILSSVVIVPNTETYMKNYFIVQLSEAVEDENVTVTCEQDPFDSMSLMILPATVYAGIDRAIMEVSALDNGDGRALVNCTANSFNNGRQFLNGRGQGALFLLDEGEVVLIPLVTELLYPQMIAYLVIDATSDSDVTFYCNLTEVDSIDTAKAIQDSVQCDVPEDITPTRPPLVNNTITSPTIITPIVTSTDAPGVNTTSGSWSLSSNTFVFQVDGERFQSMRITRSNRIQPTAPEFVVVKCCTSPELNFNQKYINTSAAFLAIAYITEEKPINWTAATDDISTPVESVVIDTAYLELGPCPCDSTENQCDVNCCCDGDCTEDDVALFTCISGIEGGESGPEVRYRCSNDYYGKPDWFPLLCVQTENSGYLGLYRQPINATRDDETYRELVAPHASYTFEEDSDRFDDTSAEARDPYVAGFAIKTGIRSDITESGVDVSNYFRLTLPQRSLSGLCVTPAPVRYLVDSANTCPRPLSESMCADFTRLSARMYAQSSGLWVHQMAPQVLRENAQTTITFTNTNYFCLSDGEVQDYLGKTTTRDEVFTDDQAYYFDDMPDLTDCNFNTQTGAYICGDLIFEADNDTAVTYTRCPWDDGFTQPPMPVLDASGNISFCNNAVVDVLYNLTWKGAEIERLDATVLLGNVPLEVAKTQSFVMEYVDPNGNVVTETFNVTNISPMQLTQKFQIEWTHSGLNDSSIEDGDEDNKVYSRSGNPGYNFGLPMFSGVDARNETFDEFLYVDTNASKSLSLWNPSVSGLCEGGSRREINFGESAQTSCMLRLGLNDLLDCETLRKSVLYQQDNLMIANYISRGGDPNRTNLDTWANVFREDISEIITTPPSDGDVTTAADTITDSITEAITTAAAAAPEDDPLSYANELVGRCANVPAQIHVDVLYALVGKVNYVPVYEVLGAKVRYGLRAWSLYCAPGGNACTAQNMEAEHARVQTFTVASSVAFVLVPPSVALPLTEYELRQQNGTSGRDEVCAEERCIEQLGYPWLADYTGEARTHNVAFGLVIAFFAAGFVLVARPFAGW